VDQCLKERVDLVHVLDVSDHDSHFNHFVQAASGLLHIKAGFIPNSKETGSQEIVHDRCVPFTHTFQAILPLSLLSSYIGIYKYIKVIGTRYYNMLEVVRFYRFLSGNCPHILHCILFELSLLHYTELKNMLLVAQHQELFILRKTFED
jgi:hypothetical protein